MRGWLTEHLRPETWRGDLSAYRGGWVGSIRPKFAPPGLTPWPTEAIRFPAVPARDYCEEVAVAMLPDMLRRDRER